MPNESPRIFVFLVRAIASGSHEAYPVGEAHSILVFVRASDDEPDPDSNSCVSILGKMSWNKIEILKHSKVELDASGNLLGGDATVKECFEEAKENGLGVIVYSGS